MKNKTKWMRLAALTLALLMSAFVLAACDGDEEDETVSTDSQTVTGTTEAPTETEPATETETETTPAPALDAAKLLEQAIAADAGAAWNLSQNMAIQTAVTINIKMDMGAMNMDMSMPMQLNIVTADGAMSMLMTTTFNDLKTTQSTIWKDGTLYRDEDGEKYKCKVNWENAQDVVGDEPVEMPMMPSVDGNLSVADLYASLSAEKAEDGSVTVTAKGLNPKAYSQMLDDSDFVEWLLEMGLVTPSFDDKGNQLDVPEADLRAALEQFNEENMIVTYTLDATGKLISNSFKLGMTTSVEDEMTGSYTMTFSCEVVTSYTYGGQTVTAPAADDASWTEVTIEDLIGMYDDDIDDDDFGDMDGDDLTDMDEDDLIDMD